MKLNIYLQLLTLALLSSNIEACFFFLFENAVICNLEVSFPPTASPTPGPSDSPSVSPTDFPSESPSESPTPKPTNTPEPTTPVPTATPSSSPSAGPTPEPTAAPSESPSESPSDAPTPAPTPAPSPSPTDICGIDRCTGLTMLEASEYSLTAGVPISQMASLYFGADKFGSDCRSDNSIVTFYSINPQFGSAVTIDFGTTVTNPVIFLAVGDTVISAGTGVFGFSDTLCAEAGGEVTASTFTMDATGVRSFFTASVFPSTRRGGAVAVVGTFETISFIAPRVGQIAIAVGIAS